MHLWEVEDIKPEELLKQGLKGGKTWLQARYRP